MVVKLIVLLLIIYVIYILFFRAKRGENIKANRAKKSSIEKSETMMECQKCSTYTSAKEAFIKNGKYYCSKECMED